MASAISCKFYIRFGIAADKEMDMVSVNSYSDHVYILKYYVHDSSFKRVPSSMQQYEAIISVSEYTEYYL